MPKTCRTNLSRKIGKEIITTKKAITVWESGAVAIYRQPDDIVPYRIKAWVGKDNAYADITDANGNADPGEVSCDTSIDRSYQMMAWNTSSRNKLTYRLLELLIANAAAEFVLKVYDRNGEIRE
jgi:hypothetical protein